MTEKEIECSITGKVQAVGFRLFASKKAKELGLVGYIKNLSDGSVDVVAQGEEEKLKEFILLLNKGSLFSRVDDVEVVWSDKLQDAFLDFTIEHDE